MGLRDLLTTTMIVQGELLAKSGPQGVGELVEGDPILSPIAQRVAQATAPLVLMEARVGQNSGQIGQLTQELLSDDGLNDGLIGGIDDLVTGAQAICEDQALRQALSEAHSAIFNAEGRARFTQAPYSALGGEAAQMTARLASAHWTALGKVKIGATSAAQALRRWLALAQAISDKEAQRAQLRAQSDDSAVARSEVVKMRNAWIRAMNAFMSAVTISDLSPQDRDRVLAPIQEAERKATEARLRRTEQLPMPPTQDP